MLPIHRDHRPPSRLPLRAGAAALALATAVSAQAAPGQTPPAAGAESTADERAAVEVDEVVGLLRRAHLGDNPAPDARAFHGTLQLHHRTEEYQADILLDVRYARTERSAYVRYRVQEGDRSIERGRDSDGPWHQVGNGAESLNAAEFTNDRRQVLQHLQLCDQLLRFTDPTRIVAAMRTPTADRQRLRVGAGREEECLRVRGTIDDFPLYAAAPEQTEHGVHVELYVGAGGRLRAVQAMPLNERGRLAGTGERILIKELASQDGLLLPTDLVMLGIGYGEQDRVLAKVRLVTLELKPGLPAEQFDRKQPW